jgi:hypothetical protein
VCVCWLLEWRHADHNFLQVQLGSKNIDLLVCLKVLLRRLGLSVFFLPVRPSVLPAFPAYLPVDRYNLATQGIFVLKEQVLKFLKNRMLEG